jgi:pimeloyl-ACP methyl ester carboxylesterase
MGRARHHRIDAVLRQLGCPVLVLRGRRDGIAPERWIESLAATTVGGVSRTLPVGAHMIPMTHPQLVAAEVRCLLRQT